MRPPNIIARWFGLGGKWKNRVKEKQWNGPPATGMAICIFSITVRDGQLFTHQYAVDIPLAMLPIPGQMYPSIHGGSIWHPPPAVTMSQQIPGMPFKKVSKVQIAFPTVVQ